MNLTDFKEAEAVMKILDHSDLDVPYHVPAVTMAESVYTSIYVGSLPKHFLCELVIK